MTRPIGKLLPVENVGISVRTPLEVSKAYTLRKPGKLPYQKTGAGYVQFVAPEIGDYEVVVLEK
jgi:hypothetical protein